ncbi:MAG: hypothetical protein AAGC46_18780 [Solirubrobacteraceae bacterium]|nr:hypothetical protein [Patulibacter sp.]
MIKSTTSTTAVAAVLMTAVALGGCGKKDDGDTGSTGTGSTPAVAQATTPTTGSTGTSGATGSSSDAAAAKWANQLCSTLVARAKPVQPPNVKGTTPEDTQQSLVTFFTTVVDTQGVQLDTLKTIGEPPVKGAVSDWKSAVKKLRTIRKRVAKVERGIKAAPANNQADLTKLMTNLAKESKTLASYNGPVSSLKTNKAIGPALQAEPACATLL